MNSLYHHSIFFSPCGDLILVANDYGLLAVLWPDEIEGRVKIPIGNSNHDHPILIKTKAQLEEYFKGTRTTFDIPLSMVGTDFQKDVWNNLLNIPYGQTRSYMDIARLIGDPKCVRAVGAANGKNPISIIVPCHRVVGSDGRLTGFAGGISVKEKLLQLESRQISLF